MKPSSILAILFVFLSTAVIVSCDKETARFSSSTNNGYATPPPASDRNSILSPVSGTDRVFYFLNSSTYPINCNRTYCTVKSRYILRNDGTFLHQYDGGNEYGRGLEYKGRYTETNNSVSFIWEAWSAAGPWGATGTLREDTLTVGYNMVMSMSDFEDAMYMRKR